MTDPTAHLQYRMRILPTQLARARERYRQLMAEAAEYRMGDLIAAEQHFMAQPLPGLPLGRDGAAASPLSAAAPPLSVVDGER